jgi:hypothetical protein
MEHRLTISCVEVVSPASGIENPPGNPSGIDQHAEELSLEHQFHEPNPHRSMVTSKTPARASPQTRWLLSYEQIRSAVSHGFSRMSTDEGE